MKLPEYCCLKAKADFFSNEEYPFYDRVDTIQDFEEKVLKIKEENEQKDDKYKFIFRGVSEAKYKMFTSAQRKYIGGEYEKMGIKYFDFIRNILQSIKEDTLLNTFFDSINLKKNDIFYLSLLQHYGAPSLLIDFTHSFETALFFATEGDFSCEKCEREIDNYFSLYYFQKNDNFYQWYNLQKASCDAFEKSIILDIRNKISHSATENASIKNDKDISFAILDDMKELKNNDGYFYWPNLNLIAQNGCFIMYNKAQLPLEQFLKEVFFIQPFHCIDIHKSLIETIRTHYCTKTKEELFPSMERCCMDAYNQFKKNLNKY